MEEIDVEQKVSELESRVAYLERELSLSYEESLFQRRVTQIFPEYADIDISDGAYGYHAFVENIDGDDVQRAIDWMDQNTDKVDYAVTETSSGVGMEVWTNGEL